MNTPSDGLRPRMAQAVMDALRYMYTQAGIPVPDDADLLRQAIWFVAGLYEETHYGLHPAGGRDDGGVL